MVLSDDQDPGMFSAGPRRGRDGPVLSLTTADIDGAQGGWKPEVAVGSVPVDKRRDFRVTNLTEDIGGAQAGSRNRGLRTVRLTDPNERNYVLLEGRPLDAEEVAVGKSWYTAASSVLAARAAAAAVQGSQPAADLPPALAHAVRVLDPRDVELAKLRGELEATRRAAQLAATTGAGSASMPLASPIVSRAAAPPSTAGSARPPAATSRKPSTAAASVGSAAAVADAEAFVAVPASEPSAGAARALGRLSIATEGAASRRPSGPPAASTPSAAGPGAAGTPSAAPAPAATPSLAASAGRTVVAGGAGAMTSAPGATARFDRTMDRGVAAATQATQSRLLRTGDQLATARLAKASHDSWRATQVARAYAAEVAEVRGLR
jgi:hypothetical protein